VASLPGFDVAAVFADEFAKAVKADEEHSGFPRDEWTIAGRGREDGAWWEENGPGLAQSFITWYESRDDVRVWITPDGVPAIELGFTAQFGRVPVRMYIDLVLEMGNDNPALVIVDLKSGTRKPENARQLAVYASGVERRYGIRPRYGAYFMARGGPLKEKTYFQTPVPLWLPQYSLDHLAGEFEMLDRGVTNQVFPAHPGEQCRRCSVAYACMDAGGHMAPLLDPNYPRRNRRAS
jgi:putative RecB family exonuclease